MTFYAEDSDVLTGGQWVRVGLVMRWQPNPEPEPQPEAEQPTYRPHDLIACPTCHARMDERCKGATRQRDHRRRLVKRVCSCGMAVRPREPMCGWCRAEMERSAA